MNRLESSTGADSQGKIIDSLGEGLCFEDVALKVGEMFGFDIENPEIVSALDYSLFRIMTGLDLGAEDFHIQPSRGGVFVFELTSDGKKGVFITTDEIRYTCKEDMKNFSVEHPSELIAQPYFEGTLEGVCDALDEMFDVEPGSGRKMILPSISGTISFCKIPDGVWCVKKNSSNNALVFRWAEHLIYAEQLRHGSWIVGTIKTKELDRKAMNVARGTERTEDPDVAACFMTERIRLVISSGRCGVTDRFYKFR